MKIAGKITTLLPLLAVVLFTGNIVQCYSLKFTPQKYDPQYSNLRLPSKIRVVTFEHGSNGQNKFNDYLKVLKAGQDAREIFIKYGPKVSKVISALEMAAIVAAAGEAAAPAIAAATGASAAGASVAATAGSAALTGGVKLGLDKLSVPGARGLNMANKTFGKFLIGSIGEQIHKWQVKALTAYIDDLGSGGSQSVCRGLGKDFKNQTGIKTDKPDKLYVAVFNNDGDLKDAAGNPLIEDGAILFNGFIEPQKNANGSYQASGGPFSSYNIVIKYKDFLLYEDDAETIPSIDKSTGKQATSRKLVVEFQEIDPQGGINCSK